MSTTGRLAHTWHCEHLMTHTTLVLCPDCRSVYETIQEEADIPSVTYDVGVNRCATCRAEQPRRAEQRRRAEQVADESAISAAASRLTKRTAELRERTDALALDVKPYDQAEHDQLRRDLAAHQRDLESHRERLFAFRRGSPSRL